MFYIYKYKNTDGNYGNPVSIKFNDCLLLPDEFLHPYLDANGFVNITVEDGVVTSVEKNVEAWEAWKQTLPSQPSELEQAKQNKILSLCESNDKAINEGTTVALSTGEENFTYALDDQTNIKEMFDGVKLGLEQYSYHENSGQCRMFSAQDIITLYFTLFTYKTKLLTYYNQLKHYVESLETVEEVNQVEYGQELTGEYLARFNEIVEQDQQEVNKVMEKFMGNA